MVGINSKEQKVKLNDGVEIGYDKLLLAPGTSLYILASSCRDHLENLIAGHYFTRMHS